MYARIATQPKPTIIKGCVQIVIIQIHGPVQPITIASRHHVETAILNQSVIIREPASLVIRTPRIGVRPLITQLQASPAVLVIHHRKVTGRVSVRIVMSLHPGLR